MPKGSKKPIDIQVASSGQMGAWPLVLTAQVLFGLDKSRRPRFLHVEEPEIHLHPKAQEAMVKILAYLVNQGFNVLVTTHSLTVLYTLNNLMLASDLGAEIGNADVPPSDLRLKPKQVAAWHFKENGEVSDIMDRDTGFISEEELGKVGEQLSAQMNIIGALRLHPKLSKKES